MTPEKEKILKERYPKLFRNDEESKKWPVNFFKESCACGDGWFEIIDEALSRLQELDVNIFQIKEKFGGLRIYLEYNGEDKKTNYLKSIEIITIAEGKSLDTCEICGKPGKQSNYIHYYIRTVCEECLKKKQIEMSI